MEGDDGKWTARKTPTRSVERARARAHLARREVRAEEPARGACRSAGNGARGRGGGRRKPRPPPREETPDAPASRLRGEAARRQDQVAGAWSSGTTSGASSRRSSTSCAAALGRRASRRPWPSAGASARLAEYAGSMFELRAVVEPHVSGDKPEPVVVYIPGCARDRQRLRSDGAREGGHDLGAAAQAARQERPAPEVHARRRRRDAALRPQGLLRGPRARGCRQVRRGAAVDPEEHLPRQRSGNDALARRVARERRARRGDRQQGGDAPS